MSSLQSGILCPDCKTNTISIIKYDQGQICNSCLHRKVWAAKKNEPYVKFIDLTQEQQEKITHQRLYNEQYREKKQLLYDSDDTSELNILEFKTVEEDQDSNNKRTGRRKYPDELYDYIIQNASPEISTQELYNQIIEKWPNLAETFTKIKLGKYLYARNLPFRRLTDDEKLKIIEMTRSKKNSAIKDSTDTSSEVVIKEVTNNESDSEEFVNNVDTVEHSICEINTSVDTYDEKARFDPIIAEVKAVLQKKFETVGCNMEYDFKIEDYIDAFKVLRFLVKNFSNIIQKRNDQYDIANNYQTDVIHEMENEISAPGDTYFQDKCHVLRNIRRNYELDTICIESMKPFLFSLSKRTAELTDIIEKLEKQKVRKDAPKYVPNVDETMINKYSWVSDTNPSTVKLMQKTLLSSNSKQNKKAGNPIYIASCYISGGGFGAFKKWTKEVSYPTREEAQRAVDLELDEIKRKNKNILITDFQLHKKAY